MIHVPIHIIFKNTKTSYMVEFTMAYNTHEKRNKNNDT